MSDRRLKTTFELLAQKKQCALVAYLMAGDPNLADSEELAVGVAQAGADVLELGFPFSDPIADGPVLQRAAGRSLAAGCDLSKVVSLAAAVRARTQIPLVLMGYLNPVLSYGEERFFADCAKAGVDGLILPDLPLDEAARWRTLADASGIDLIFLVAPTSTEARARALCDASRGFLYCVSSTGVTGVRKELPPDLGARLAFLRKTSKVPVAVGFGVSSPEQAAALSHWADGVVVGSALASELESSKSTEEALRRVTEKVALLSAALKNA